MNIKRTLKTLIVDDERLARKALHSLLDETGMVEVIGEADSVASAMAVISVQKPDLIFLDIQMPGQSGFDLISKLNYSPNIIFVTAYDEYALRAFEVNALDYLVKPVTPARLVDAISRVHEEPQMLKIPEKTLSLDDRLFLQFSSNYIFLKIDQIVVITSSGDYSEVRTKDGKHGLTNKSMLEWEKRLPENTFIRIHRSFIINLNFVEKVEDWFNNSFRVYVTGVEEPFVMSRRYTSLIKNKLG